MTFEKSYFEHNRLALAVFRATSVDDADALAVLEQRLGQLPSDEREVVEGMTRNIFAAARKAPESIDAERFFDGYSARLDDLERALLRPAEDVCRSLREVIWRRRLKTHTFGHRPLAAWKLPPPGTPTRR